MSNPNESLQCVVVSASTARTRAKSECGEPVIQGRVSAGEATGLVRLVSE